MALTVNQLGKALVSAGLFSTDELTALWNSLPADARPKQGDGLAQLLIQQGKLNQFQVDELLSGRKTPLVMGDYVLLAKIGEGGMGQVYKARHKRMNRMVALKVMSAAAMKDEASVKRFQREVHAAARLEHPNIVTAYDSGEVGNVKYLVMQFVDGVDLSSLVKKNGPLSIEQAVDYVLQTARGLSFAHGEGVIHRDIKPANLLLDKKGLVKILDMGLARFEGGDDGLTGTEQVMGTVDYMSPEQAAQTKGVDGRADIYSLGCTLWMLLTGIRTYEADTMIARLMAHRDAPLPSLLKTRDDAPWPLEQAFHRMIAKRAEDRFQTMDEVIAALLPFGGGGASSSGMGSSLGHGSPQNAELSAFLKGAGPQTGTKSRIIPAAPKTSIESDATAELVKADVETDPKSEISVPPLGPKTAVGRDRAATAKPQATGNRRKRPPLKLIAGGIGGFALLVALGVWVYVKDKDGNDVAVVEVPDGGRVVFKTDPRPTGSGGVAATPKTPGASAADSPEAKPLTIAQRLTSPDYEWSAPESLGPTVNATKNTSSPTLSDDQLCLIVTRFGSSDPKLNGVIELRRPTVDAPWGGSIPVLSGFVGKPALSSDGLMLFTTIDSKNADGAMNRNVALLTRPTRIAPWGKPTEIPNVNSDRYEERPVISPDGLTLVVGSYRSGSLGNLDLWISRRADLNADWQPPVNLGPKVNTPQAEKASQILADGKTILVNRDSGDVFLATPDAQGNYDLRQVPLPPDIKISKCWLSPDGATLYFDNYRKSGIGEESNEIRVIRRVPKQKAGPTQVERLLSADYEWSEPESLGPTVNAAKKTESPTLTDDQLRLIVFRYEKSGDPTNGIQELRRPALDAPWEAVVQLTALTGAYPSLSADGLTLVSVANNNNNNRDLFQCFRTSRDTPWSDPQPMASLNTTATEYRPVISPDGLSLVFSSDRPGGVGKLDLWISRRANANADWQPPVNLGAKVNTPNHEEASQILADGKTILARRGREHFLAAPDAQGVYDLRPVPWPAKLKFSKCWLSPDGTTLYFDNRNDSNDADTSVSVMRRVPKTPVTGAFGSPGAKALSISERPAVSPVQLPAVSAVELLTSPDYVWSEPENLGPSINGPGSEEMPSLTNDQLRILYLPAGEGWREAVRASASLSFDLPGNGLTYLKEASLSGDGLDLISIHAAAEGGGMRLFHRPTFDAKWGKPVDLPQQANGPGLPRHPHFSADRLAVLFQVVGKEAKSDIWITRRASPTEPFGPATPIGPPVNTDDKEERGFLLGDGRTFVFRRGGQWFYTVSSAAGEKSALPLGESPLNTADQAWFAPDGQTVYFAANRPGGLGGTDIWVTRRVPKISANPARWPFDPPDGREYVWGEPENLGPTINGDKDDQIPAISGDGLRLVYQRNNLTCEASRTALDQPFGKSNSINEILTKAGLERPRGLYLTPDGLALYFSARPKSDPTGNETRLYFVRRTGLDAAWGTPAPAAGIPDKSFRMSVSPDELKAYFSAHRSELGKQNSLFTATRTSLAAPFEAITLVALDYKTLGATVDPHLMPDGRTLVFRRGGSTETGERFGWARRDAAGNWTSRLFERLGSHPSDEHPSLTADGRTMFFESNRPGGLGGADIWVTRRVPKAGAAANAAASAP